MNQIAKPQTTLEFGPIHPWLPGAVGLSLDLHGDQIIGSRLKTGFLSKNIEAKILGKDLSSAQIFFSRIDPEGSMILDRIFSEGIEDAFGWILDARALWIRDITSSVSEEMSVLKYLAQMADVLGLPIVRHIVLKHREELLDLVELLTGSRYGYYFVVPGGTRYDITDGFLERLENWVNKFQSDFERIESMFLWTHGFQNRLKSLGRVIDEGSYGFVSEASIETTHYGVVSHVESRIKYALKESLDFAKELHALCGDMQPGQFRHEGERELKKKSVEIEQSTYRGTWSVKMEFYADKVLDATLKSIRITTPSDRIIEAMGPSLENEQLEDLPVILQSLNFLVTELDR